MKLAIECIGKALRRGVDLKYTGQPQIVLEMCLGALRRDLAVRERASFKSRQSPLLFGGAE